MRPNNYFLRAVSGFYALCIGFQFSMPFKENGREVQGLPGEFVQ
jgi:hypothetical protein